MPHYPTPLEAFLKQKKLKPVHVAVHAETSRQHLLRVRMGRVRPRKRKMAQILVACRVLTRNAALPAQILFTLDDPTAAQIEEIAAKLEAAEKFRS